jgi:hypothetical protein
LECFAGNSRIVTRDRQCLQKNKKRKKKKKFGLFLNRVTVSIQEGFFKM